MKNSLACHDGELNKLANVEAEPLKGFTHIPPSMEEQRGKSEVKAVSRRAEEIRNQIVPEREPEPTARWGSGDLASAGLEELFGCLIGRQPRAEQDQALELLGRRRLARLARSTPMELAGHFGLTGRDSRRLAAAFELGRRAISEEVEPAPACSSAEQVFRLVHPELSGLERERFLVLLLDGKHRLARMEPISEGTLTTSLVHPREVFRSAVRESAAALIAVHNHPSGDPEPSSEDLEVTRRLRRAGRLLGIPLLDHVVVGAGRFVSLRERLW